jgi:transposase InsO family protein
MNKQQTPDDVAATKLRMITPLMDESLDASQIIELKKKISEENNISYRSISRYLEAYQQEGFAGLKPKTGYKRNQSTLPDNFPDMVEHAIILRRECPTRSVTDIIRILELEEIIKPGTVHRSTLQRHLQAKGFGAAQVKLYSKKGAASRRFAKSHRCMLFQGDIKYGPYLPIGKDGAMKQVYLSVFIDDATRYIMAAKFYDNQKVEIIEDSLRAAIMHFGKPDKIFVDNGKQYRSEWLKKACDRLGIRLLFSKPYHPEGKGKIEAFNRRVDAFLSEVALNKPKTLEELNDALDVWISQYYHKNVHTSLDGLTPEVAFGSDKRALRFVDAKELAEAFLHTETRQVDKTGCISFKGNTYDVGTKLIGRQIEVRYDPTWKDEIEIHHKDFKPFKAGIQQIGENCGIRAELPEGLSPLEANTSRLLDGLNKANTTGRTRSKRAVSYSDIGGASDV